MEGHLKLFILRELRDKSKSGYELMLDFKDFSGKKPSPGTVYPLLNCLLNKGFLKVCEKSNKKMYSLSKKGENALENFKNEHIKIIERAIKVFGFISGPKEAEEMKKAVSMLLKKGNLGREVSAIIMLRGSFIKFVNSKNYPSKRKEFLKIMKGTSKKIEGLCD